MMNKVGAQASSELYPCPVLRSRDHTMLERCIELRDLGWAADGPLLLIERTNRQHHPDGQRFRHGEGGAVDKPIAGLAILAGNIID
jgi:hypothetical protein